MAVSDPALTQRISRLTPLDAILALIRSRVEVVTPRGSSLASARGRVLAADVVASGSPPAPIALRDGFAVAAGAVADAGPYSPVPLAVPPPRVDVGEPLPSGADSVVPFDAVRAHGGRAEVVAAVVPGDGALAAGGDVAPLTTLRRAGQRLRDIDIAAMAGAGITDVTIRDPRVRIACGTNPKSPLVLAGVETLARAVVAAGGLMLDAERSPEHLYVSLSQSRVDTGLVVGGTGGGRNDASVQLLSRHGRVEAHGIAVAPGETTAFGFIGTRPVLLLPGRLDAMLAAWLLIGRHLIARLAGGRVEDTAVTLPLRRKATSTIGLVELVPVSCTDGMAEPLASGYLSLAALARSDGWIVIPAESEGFAAGAQVAVKPWP